MNLQLKEFDIRDITLDNMGNWPKIVKVVAIVLVFVLIMIIGYWFDTTSQLQTLSDQQDKEVDLRKTFEIKQQETANIATYKTQIQVMQRLFATMVRQLPNRTEVPGLLEDISKTGIANGLEFKLFKPLPEKQNDFFAELPIQISVVGSYHQLAQFVSQVASLDRIVTLQNFEIQRQKPTNSTLADATTITNEGKLLMDMTAVTYRYAEEAPAPKKDKDK